MSKKRRCDNCDKVLSEHYAKRTHYEVTKYRYDKEEEELDFCTLDCLVYHYSGKLQGIGR